MEQRKIDRSEEAVAAKVRLAHPDQLQVEGRSRDLAMFHLAIDSKLRGCDVVPLKVEDIAANGHAVDRAIVRQKKTRKPVRFELADQTRQAVDHLLWVADKRPGEFSFAGRRGPGRLPLYGIGVP